MTRPNRPYGVGLAYRNCLHREIMQFADRIDLLEIPTEDYIVRSRRLGSDPDGGLLRQALATFPSVAHGISMSLGSVEPLDRNYMEGTVRFLEECGLDTFSEHLAFHRLGGVDLTMFLSMPFEEASVEWVARNYEAARETLGRPFALENVSYYFPVPGCALDEAEFLTRLTERTDCSLLLDVTNIYNNAQNHGYDAIEFLHRLPGERVSQLHLAGGHYSDGMWQDSHSAPVMQGVWELMDDVLEHTAADLVILERDSNFIPFENVVADLDRARSIFRRHRPAAPLEKPGSGSAHASNSVELRPADPLASEFADLRSFQRALIREITDPEFCRRVRHDGGVSQTEYPMSDAWRRRWRGCNPERIDLLAGKWEWISDDERLDAQRYRQMEWQRWAQQLGVAPTPTYWS